jgi:hypothetical protein
MLLEVEEEKQEEDEDRKRHKKFIGKKVKIECN